MTGARLQHGFGRIRLKERGHVTRNVLGGDALGKFLGRRSVAVDRGAGVQRSDGPAVQVRKHLQLAFHRGRPLVKGVAGNDQVEREDRGAIFGGLHFAQQLGDRDKPVTGRPVSVETDLVLGGHHGRDPPAVIGRYFESPDKRVVEPVGHPHQTLLGPQIARGEPYHANPTLGVPDGGRAEKTLPRIQILETLLVRLGELAAIILHLDPHDFIVSKLKWGIVDLLPTLS